MFSRREFIRLSAYWGIGTSITTGLIKIPEPSAFSFGEYTLEGHFAQNVSARSILAGDTYGHWQIIDGKLTTTGAQLDRKGYQLQLDNGKNISISVEANTYTVTPKPDGAGELGVVATILEKHMDGDRVIKIGAGDQLWVNSNAFLSNRFFKKNVTITSYDIANPVRFLTARSGINRGELRTPKNLHFVSVQFYAHFDRTFHNSLSVGLATLGNIDNVSFDLCQFRDNRLEIGPGVGFRGLLGGDGTSKIIGPYSITNNLFDGGSRCLQISHRSNTKGTGQVTVSGNEMRNFGVDGTIFALNNDNMVFEDNYSHSPYSDPWRTSWNRASIHRKSLKKASSSKQITAFVKGNFRGKASSSEMLLDGPLKVERTPIGTIKVSCGSLLLETRTKINSATNYEILLSINTDNISRLMLRYQGADGQGNFILEDSVSATGDVIKLKGAISMGSALDKAKKASGYIERLIVWHNVAPNIEQEDVQKHFSTSWNDRKLPDSAVK